jgi:serine O-acetyltransferase
MTVGSKRFRDLEATIDGVVASYGSDLEINNLESSALPNKRSVIEAIEHIKAALFVGFYATRVLHQDNLRQTIAEHLYPAHALLVEQIERALTYDHWRGESEIPPVGSGERVVLGLFKSIPELRRLIDTDVRAAYDGDPAAKNVEEIVFSYPSIEAVTAYRIANHLYRAGVPMIPRMITEHAHARTGIDISPGATIGERFFIDHGTGVVIGETTLIGHSVKLYQGVTLGALSVPRRTDNRKRHPTLEDNVTIYAGATILGGETVIGTGSVVGGNVWLTKSVPPGSRVFGRGRDEDA